MDKSFFKEEVNRLSESRKLEIVDIVPKEEKAEVPILVAPGWAGTPETLKETLKVFAGDDRRVISVKHSRAREISESAVDYPLEEVQKAAALLATLEEKGIEKTDAVAYSEGGINLAIAASLCPEKFRNIVFVSPAGMIGRDSFWGLTGRFSWEVLKNTVKTIDKPETAKPMLTFYKELLGYLKENVKLAFGEVKAISEANIYQMVNDLKEKGIGVSFIFGNDDSVFNMEKVQEYIKKERLAGHGSFKLDGFYSVKGGHFEIFSHPEKYGGLVKDALATLDKKTK